VPKNLVAQGFPPGALVSSKAAAAGGGASCPADGSPSLSQTQSDNAQQFGLNADIFFLGPVFQDPTTTRQVCKICFQLSAAGGTIVSKFYTCRIYTLSSGNLNTIVTNGQSGALAGIDASTERFFLFSGNPTITAATDYGIVVYPSDSGGSPVAFDATNKAQMSIKETTNPLANCVLKAWNNTFGLDSSYTNTDPYVKFYWYA
jgi:hypothetical protein